MFGGSNSVLIQINGSANGLQAAVAQANNSLGQLGQGAQQAADGGFNAFQRFAITLSSIANLAQMAANALSPMLDQVEQLGKAMFDLNVSTEKNVYSWQYLFGGGARGRGIAANMAQWTSQFSMDIPFTRQDLISAISTLSTTMGAGQIQQFMPVLADITSSMGASAYGGHGMTLAQGAYALMDLMMGRSRMFTQEFHIRPEDLIKYGLKGTVNRLGGVHIEDMSTLIPALEAYDKARGLSGAAKGAATQTWWGEWSSLIDRFQNFGLMAGGTGLSGAIDPKSFFGQAKQALNDLSSWMDAHSTQIAAFAKLIAEGLGGAFATVADNLKGFLTGLQQSGLLEGLGLAPSAPTTPAGKLAGRAHGAMNAYAGGHGTPAAQQLSGAAQFGQQLGQAIQAVAPLVHDLANIFFEDLLPAVHAVTAWLVENFAPAAAVIAQFIQQKVIPAVMGLASWFGEHVMPVAQKMAGMIVSVVVPALGSIWQTVQAQLLPALQQLWTAIEPTLIPALQVVGGIIGNLIVPAIKGAIEAVSLLVTAFAGAITIVEKIWTVLQGIGTWIATTFTAVWSNLGNAIVAALKVIPNTIIALIDQLILAIDKIDIKIPKIDLPGGHSWGGGDIKPFNIPTIPALASGGRVLSAGLAIVGEHGAELVHLPTGAQVDPHGAGGYGGRYGDTHNHYTFHGLNEQQVLAIMSRQQQAAQLAYSATRRGPGGGNISAAVNHGWGSGTGSW